MYYVYTGNVNGEVLYVGKGYGSRYLHLNSGCSNVYEANKLHFSGTTIEVSKVFKCKTSSEALEFESHLISELSPSWNKVHTGGNTYKRNQSTSKFLGVSYCSKNKTNKWRAWYRIDNVKKHIGYFKTENEAVIARDLYITENSISGRLNKSSIP